ncbi:sigma-54 dependent transcriptional regulator [Fluviicola sp.]|uniref:sigma-54-dependent transcriptional regulator n=1 Tax=Fluviicola sp. TaxID=1917219 RepID=UPI002636C6E3|nr:sigma-54 dependent transcriptional regulator [Fluviicola sp.]
MNKILLIEDDPTFSKIVTTFLTKKGYEISTASSLQAGEKLLQAEKFDLLLLDYRLPDGIGLELIAKMGTSFPALPTVIITSFDDVRTAVKSIQSGAFEYIIKPINPDELLLVIQAALQKKTETPENSTQKSTSSEKKGETKNKAFIKGESAISQKLYEYIDLVAPTDLSVMIIGESGTGKEHVARSIHNQSKRSQGPFVAIDCGVLSKELAASELFGHAKGSFTGALQDKVGVLEKANGGTLFLDEIGNLSYDVQIKLLRTLQERTIEPVGSGKSIPIDIRLITATNENLLQEIGSGNFREDIYHRINEFKIQMPALRDRGADLELFIRYFIERSNEELDRSVKQVPADVIRVFQQYDWPGNLRELGNVIKRLVLLSKGTEISMDSLPEELIARAETANPNDLKLIQETNERETILNALVQTRYNKSKAAKLLNIDRKTLYSKIEKYQLD